MSAVFESAGNLTVCGFGRPLGLRFSGSTGLQQRCGVAISHKHERASPRNPLGRLGLHVLHAAGLGESGMPMCLCRWRSRPPRCLALAVKLCHTLAARGLATPGLAVFLADHLPHANTTRPSSWGFLNHLSCLSSLGPQSPFLCDLPTRFSRTAPNQQHLPRLSARLTQYTLSNYPCRCLTDLCLCIRYLGTCLAATPRHIVCLAADQFSPPPSPPLLIPFPPSSTFILWEIFRQTSPTKTPVLTLR